MALVRHTSLVQSTAASTEVVTDSNNETVTDRRNGKTDSDRQ